ncbi:Glycerol-3-phosphate dehydrogenase, mitochondrial [Bagarius yarrelli]|uniref:Glycerol-3-phosphate dehydrogenase, mitochondrial n=1 Tax=Bagarius yarrelli TaxID=175774 RepID=A0A556VBU8_BAGYA|nr:Glycerol-3-phosphate dehydrogenase, mitochondrial [Bagarius yarrelli]
MSSDSAGKRGSGRAAQDGLRGQTADAEEQLAALQNTPEFDVLVVGGGATGSGCALDAVTRNLKTALVERSDFSSGTSSRSTKLIHGGVRYLQKAIMKLDYEQLPYYWAGIKMYDLVAGGHCLKSSYILSKSKALELFPMLKKDKLVGAIVYYDGQHNDSRMNLAIALTAARYGAAIANYKHTEVTELLKATDPLTGKEKVCGARCRDVITGREFNVRAKCVINATGPFTDSLRKMDNQKTANICQPSAGVHIVIPGYYRSEPRSSTSPWQQQSHSSQCHRYNRSISQKTIPDNMGLLDPATSDGRVIFFLPWEKMTIAGTTDTPTAVTAHPIPTEEDINFILSEVRNYLSPDVDDTQSICRNHIVNISQSGLVTIAGGKWTTYRAMAEETLDAAIKEHKLHAGPNRTVGLTLDGGKDWTPTLYIRLVQDYGLENEVAQHLAATYGGRAFEVAKMAQVIYGIREYACTAIDMISRRTRLGFLNVQAADEALPRIVDIMAKELKWSEEKKKKRFYKFDKESKGFITTLDVQQVLEKLSVQIDENALHEILNEVDLNKNGQVELDEFLQLMSAVQRGQISDSRLAILMKTAEEGLDSRGPVSVDRSGGGPSGPKVSPPSTVERTEDKRAARNPEFTTAKQLTGDVPVLELQLLSEDPTLNFTDGRFPSLQLGLIFREKKITQGNKRQYPKHQRPRARRGSERCTNTTTQQQISHVITDHFTTGKCQEASILSRGEV